MYQHLNIPVRTIPTPHHINTSPCQHPIKTLRVQTQHANSSSYQHCHHPKLQVTNTLHKHIPTPHQSCTHHNNISPYQHSSILATHHTNPQHTNTHDHNTPHNYQHLTILPLQHTNTPPYQHPSYQPTSYQQSRCKNSAYQHLIITAPTMPTSHHAIPKRTIPTFHNTNSSSHQHSTISKTSIPTTHHANKPS